MRHRQKADDPWTVTALTIDENLRLSAIGSEIRVGEFSEDLDFDGTGGLPEE